MSLALVHPPRHVRGRAAGALLRAALAGGVALAPAACRGPTAPGGGGLGVGGAPSVRSGYAVDIAAGAAARGGTADSARLTAVGGKP